MTHPDPAQPKDQSALEPCPFCGGNGSLIERHNPMSKWRWSVDCDRTTCGMAGPVESSKAEAIAAWNQRTEPDELARLRAENEALRAELAKANEAHWFYYGDGCSSDQCRFDINECIDEDFEWDNCAQGDHVLQISGARPVPDMWVALHYFTNAEKDARDDDEPYTFTVHDSEELARKALENRND